MTEPKVKTLEVDYGRKESKQLRDEVISLRNKALHPDFDATQAVVLSHVISWMAVIIEEKWPN